MPMVPAGGEDAYETINSVGPVAQAVPVLPNPLPATLAASGTWQSGIINGDGFKVIAAAITSTQAGVLSVQRFLNQTGTVALAAAATVSLTANSPAVLTITDGLPFASFQISVSNTGGSSATLSAFAALLNAA